MTENNGLMVIDQAAMVGLPNDISIIQEKTLRANWDVKAAKPVFETEHALTQNLYANLLSATMVYACWSEQLGKPRCQGLGEQCPDHPESSSPGIVLICNDDVLGTMYIVCYGLLYRWAIGAVKKAVASDGVLETSGWKDITTQHGTFKIPQVKK